jgi:hypothetical protein
MQAAVGVGVAALSLEPARPRLDPPEVYEPASGSTC